jgi:copper chaperone CopZ
MAWTASKTAKTKDQSGNVTVTIEYVNGDDRVTQKLNGDDLTEASIADHVAKKIESLTARDAAFDAITIGPVTPVKAEVDPLVVTYENAIRNLQKIEQQVALKVIAVDAKEYTDALDAAKAAKAALADADVKPIVK